MLVGTVDRRVDRYVPVDLARGIGLGEDLAILDRHILKNLALLGVIDEVPSSPTKRTYLEIERKMTAFSKQAGIPMGELDLLLWYKEAGEVFK